MSYVDLGGTFVNLQTAGPSSGILRFSMPFQLVNTTTDEIIVPSDFTATLDANGSFSISLPATDDPDFLPDDRYWRVTEMVDGKARDYAILLPASPSTQDLADIAPIEPTDPNQVYTLLPDVAALAVVVSGHTDKLAGYVDLVGDYGAVGDGATNDTGAWDDAVTEAVARDVPLVVRGGTFLINAGRTLPGGLVVLGAGKSNTTLVKRTSGDMFEVASNLWQWHNLTIEGDGGDFTGKCFDIAATFGAQAVMEDVRLLNFEGPCIYWASACGSLFRATRLDAYRYGGATGSDEYAIVYDDAAPHAGKYHSYSQYASHGKCAFDFGALDGCFISLSSFSDLKFRDDSTAIHISDSRWNNQVACSIRGTLVTLKGMNVLPALTLETDASSCDIDTMNNVAVPVDSSGNASNRINYGLTAYTPVLSSSGGGAALGNGTLVGTHQRRGTETTVSVNLVMGSAGSGATLGAGITRLSIPFTIVSTSTIQIAGQAWFGDVSTGNVYTGIVNALGGTSFVDFYFAGSPGGAVGATTPFTWAEGDFLRFQATIAH